MKEKWIFTRTSRPQTRIMYQHKHEGALIEAVIAKDVATLESLIGGDVDVNAPGSDGFPPLHLAADEGDVEVVRILLRFPGMDVNTKDSYGVTALERAVDSTDEEALVIANDIIAHSSFTVTPAILDTLERCGKHQLANTLRER